MTKTAFRPNHWIAALAVGLTAGLAVAEAPQDGPQDGPRRPHEPWVFRSVLDQQARMVTIALSPELWVAYDAKTCGLYRAWPGGEKDGEKGGVLFTGPVYNDRHGPQPQSEGTPYQENKPGTQAWSASRGGSDVAVKTKFDGYRRDGQKSVTLLYTLALDGGAAVKVEESPEATAAPDGKVTLRRTFKFTGISDGTTVKLMLAADATGGEVTLGVDGTGTFATDERGAGTVAYLDQSKDGETTVVTTYAAQK